MQVQSLGPEDPVKKEIAPRSNILAWEISWTEASGVSPVLRKFCNKIPLACKVKFLSNSQSLCQIPRLGNLLWVLELSKQCENVFGLIVLQFVGHLLGGFREGLLVTSSKRAYATGCVTQLAAPRVPTPVAVHY